MTTSATISAPPPDFPALLTLLDDECGTLEAFVVALDEEQHTLSRSADVSALPAIVARKSELYGRLQTLGRARSAWLSGNRLADMADTVARSPEVGARWSNVVALAKTARRTNETNGRLVRTRMTYNKSALDAIRGAHGKAPAVYGADGRF
ncbi:flagellar protein FlgN [Robbsia sp. Bb-Pol-6]|uniref:Flagellar protein FlgN n=1 Tax=Robbsia betulipollinis TaxID=2981849 RepID=A0ABT3ZHL1_9BURK|nr:flagellar protein FlgN [Robbsia betulipollinis]MCY0386020.1 flagellar protein FlgN [Robbsia betulipollinis]